MRVHELKKPALKAPGFVPDARRSWASAHVDVAGDVRSAASAGNGSVERLRRTETHRLAERVRELKRNRADAARRGMRTT